MEPSVAHLQHSHALPSEPTFKRRGGLSASGERSSSGQLRMMGFGMLTLASALLLYLRVGPQDFNVTLVIAGCVIAAFGWLILRNLSPSVLATALGLLIPVYSLAGTPPIIWDALRLILAVSLVLRPGGSVLRQAKLATAMAMTGLAFLLVSLISADPIGGRYGLALVSGSIIATSISSSLATRFLGAFVAGSALSALAHVVAVTTGVDPGAGLVGLGSVSTVTGPILVLAAAILTLRIITMRDALRVSLLVLLSIGVLLSGNRSGVIALGFLVVTALLARSNSAPVRAGILLSSAAVTWVAIQARWPSMDRLLILGGEASRSSIQEDYSSGRIDLLRIGIQQLPDVWLSGGRSGMGHSTFLSWPGYYGIVGVVALVVLFWMIVRWLPWQVSSLVVFFSAFETEGLLQGGSGVAVLCVISSLHLRSKSIARSHRTRPEGERERDFVQSNCRSAHS